MVDFVVRYFKPDGSFWDLSVGLHNLGLPRKYGFFTTILSFADFHGSVDLDISTFAYNLHNWPRCEVFLRVDSNMYKLFSGAASFGHHGEPEGYRFN